MKKIPALFLKREDNPGLYREEMNPACGWVLRPDVIMTRKWDGTAVMVQEGRVWARLDCKGGKQAPEGAIPCQEPDLITGHHPHWVQATRPEDKWIREAFENTSADFELDAGTYEACGPRIGSNNEQMKRHWLIRHGALVLNGSSPLLCSNQYDAMLEFLKINEIEGVVFHGPDGLMCKCTRKGMGLEWPVKR